MTSETIKFVCGAEAQIMSTSSATVDADGRRVYVNSAGVRAVFFRDDTGANVQFFSSQPGVATAIDFVTVGDFWAPVVPDSTELTDAYLASRLAVRADAVLSAQASVREALTRYVCARTAAERESAAVAQWVARARLADRQAAHADARIAASRCAAA